MDALEAARRLTKKPNNELMIALGDLYVTMELPKTARKCYSAVPKAASTRLAALGRQFVQDGDVDSAMTIAETLKKSLKHTGEADLLTRAGCSRVGVVNPRGPSVTRSPCRLHMM